MTLSNAMPADRGAAAIAAFTLHSPDSGPFAFAPTRGVALAAMLRHAACQAALGQPDAAETELFVAGHVQGGPPQERISYLPLPDIALRADGLVRHVMLAAPAAQRRQLQAVAKSLCDAVLTNMQGQPVARLKPAADDDDVVAAYLQRPAGECVLTSVTPVVLPGFDERRSDKALKLFQRCLRQAGIREEDVIAVKFIDRTPWPGTKPATAYDRPQHCERFTCRHIQVMCRDWPAGPAVLGAGRFRGLGLLACGTNHAT